MLVRIARHPYQSPIFKDLFDVERKFDSLLSPFLGETTFLQSRSHPAVDISEGDDESVVSMELPGVGKDDISITLNDGKLTISGERKQTAIPENAKWLRNETTVGEFSRTIVLPHQVDVSRVSAEMNDGILRVTLPKAEEARPREVKVR